MGKGAGCARIYGEEKAEVVKADENEYVTTLNFFSCLISNRGWLASDVSQKSLIIMFTAFAKNLHH